MLPHHQCEGDHPQSNMHTRDHAARQRSDPPAREGPDMQWLPYHLILECLPLRKRCQLRCVCKAWNIMLSIESDTVLVTKQEIWLVMARTCLHDDAATLDWEFKAYSSLHKETESLFFRFPLPNLNHRSLCSLLGERHCRHLAFDEACARDVLACKYPFFGSYPLASAGCLISAIVRRPGVTMDDLQVIVFNCMSGSVQVLPSPLRSSSNHRTYSIFMKVDSQDSSWYHIMLSDSLWGCFPFHFQIFDSRSCCWTVGHKFSESSVTDFPMLDITDGDFFFFHTCLFSGRSWLRAYHVSHNAWSAVVVPSWPLGELSAIATYEGRLLLGVPLVNTDVHPWRRLGFGVMELQLDKFPGFGTWAEVSRTPQHLLPPVTSDFASKLASGPLFYMTTYDKTGAGPPLVFDIAQNSWYFLPWNKSMRDFVCMMVHQPEFSKSRRPCLTRTEGFGGFIAESCKMRNEQDMQGHLKQ